MKRSIEREKDGMAVKYVLVVLGIFSGDLWIKNRIEGMTEAEIQKMRSGSHENRPCREGRERKPSLIVVRRYHNKGAMLNFGESRRLAVTAAALGMTGIMTVFFVLSLGHKGGSLLKAGLSLLLGGAFSNAYDRLKRGYVVDYFSLNLKWEPLRRVVFNISDFCILIGALLVAIGT